jgi:hypothetical protein
VREWPAQANDPRPSGSSISDAAGAALVVGSGVALAGGPAVDDGFAVGTGLTVGVPKVEPLGGGSDDGSTLGAATVQPARSSTDKKVRLRRVVVVRLIRVIGLLTLP